MLRFQCGCVVWSQDQKLAPFFHILETAWTIPESGELEGESPNIPAEGVVDGEEEGEAVDVEGGAGHGAEKDEAAALVETKEAVEDRKRKPEEVMPPPPVPHKVPRDTKAAAPALSAEEVELRVQALQHLGMLLHICPFRPSTSFVSCPLSCRLSFIMNIG